MPVKRPRPKWMLAIACLLGGGTVAETAAAAGVSERTVYAWLALPAFDDLLRAERRRVVVAAGLKLQTLTTKAISSLEALLTCGNRPTEARVALAILAATTKALDLSDVSARLAKLERRKRRAGSEKPPSEATVVTPEEFGERVAAFLHMARRSAPDVLDLVVGELGYFPAEKG